MQDAGAARNQRTSNGPSGTPAPTECMTGATAEQPRAVGDAGPYGGIDESTPVLGGAPMRSVGDADPYAVRHCRAVRGSGSGDRSGSDSLWAFLRRITFGVKEFQRPWVFGGVFASFCRRGQKDVAPEREISLPEA